MGFGQFWHLMQCLLHGNYCGGGVSGHIGLRCMVSNLSPTLYGILLESEDTSTTSSYTMSNGITDLGLILQNALGTPYFNMITVHY